MYLTADRNGTVSKEDSLQDRLLGILYRHMAGRAVLRLLVCPAVTKAGGKFLDHPFSRFFIPAFIRSHSVRMADFEQKEYVSYNDFFTRKLRPGARRLQMDGSVLVSPCDSRLSVFRIGSQSVFSLKHTSYTLQSLLRSRKLARAYAGGYIWIFRLCVDDYHRYIYVDGGTVSDRIRIPGVFHTVNPVANDYFPVYKENTREYCLVKTEHFGTMLQMEVGAMMVGKIVNHPAEGKVRRGQEKGYFAFGGSTVILLTQAGKVQPDPDIVNYSVRGIETKVKLGERVGAAVRPGAAG